ncbi:MAG: TIGR01777 family oxidoreductase [Bacteroidota bacterium]
MKNILIAGGSGLIGQHLTKVLLRNNYQVAWLSRKESPNKLITSYLWNPDKHFIDSAALKFADAIIVLSGENIAEKRWTSSFKSKIISSRIHVANTLKQALEKNTHHVQFMITASAIGFYGNRGEELLNEESVVGNDFLAETTKQWEEAYEGFKIPLAKLRIGVVLAKEGGALPQMTKSLKWGIASPLGNGKQYISWIHIKDLTEMMRFILKNQQAGIFNAVAPHPLSNADFTSALKKQINTRALTIPAPAFMIHLLLGEKSAIVLNSTRVSSNKIAESGFTFQFNNLESALKDIYE